MSLQIKQLRSSFKRLETLYHEALDTNTKLKADQEVKEIKSTEDYTRIVKQNEVLKEKVEVLFKLGKSYLETNNTCGTCSKTVEESSVATDRCPQENLSTSVEVNSSLNVLDDETNNHEETWRINKLRGFEKKNVVNETPRDSTAASQISPMSSNIQQQSGERIEDTRENTGEVSNEDTREKTGDVKNVDTQFEAAELYRRVGLKSLLSQVTTDSDVTMATAYLFAELTLFVS